LTYVLLEAKRQGSKMLQHDMTVKRMGRRLRGGRQSREESE
jgi:hypothetical protein